MPNDGSKMLRLQPQQVVDPVELAILQKFPAHFQEHFAVPNDSNLPDLIDLLDLSQDHLFAFLDSLG